MNRRGFLTSLLGLVAGPPAAALLLPAPKQEQSGIAIARQAQREWEECPNIHQVVVCFESKPGEMGLDERYHWPAVKALIGHLQDEYERGARGFRSIDLPHPRGVSHAATYTLPAPAGGDALKIRYVRQWEWWKPREEEKAIHRYDCSYWWLHEPAPRRSNRIAMDKEFMREALKVLEKNLQATRLINREYEREFAR